MKKAKLLLFVPIFALLASCSGSKDATRKDMPKGGTPVTEEAEQVNVLDELAEGLLNTLGEEHFKFDLHLDAHADHLPLNLKKVEEPTRAEAAAGEEAEIVYNDVKVNADVEFVLSMPAEGPAGMVLTVKDLDLSISNFLEVSDVKLSIRYDFDATQGGYLFLDLSDESIKNVFTAVKDATGVDIESAVATILGQNRKVKVSFDLIMELIGGLMGSMSNPYIMMDGVLEEEQPESPVDNLKAGWQMALAFLDGMEIEINEEQAKEFLESVKDYLSMARYGVKGEANYRAGAALNLSNEQFHALVNKYLPEEEPAPAPTNGQNLLEEDGEEPILDGEDEEYPVMPGMPEIDMSQAKEILDKLEIKAGILLLVGNTKGQEKNKATFEELSISAEGKYEEQSAGLNLSVLGSYGENAAYAPLSAAEANGYRDISTLLSYVISGMLG